MSNTMPVLTLTVDGEAFEVAVSRVDLLRLERIDDVSMAEAFDKSKLALIYKMAWLALQRMQHPAVAPFADLTAVTARDLLVGAESLAEAADLEVGTADTPKEDSATDQPTG